MQYKRCREKGCHVEKNRRQEEIKDRQRWCGCIEKAVWPRETKAQQDGTWSGELESTAKEGSS